MYVLPADRNIRSGLIKKYYLAERDPRLKIFYMFILKFRYYVNDGINVCEHQSSL